jgi:chromatin modification-related protein VID21
LTDSRFIRNRLFDESRLPTRRQLRSDTSKQRSPIRKVSPDTRIVDGSRKPAKGQRDGSRSRRSRASSPASKSAEHGTDETTQGLSIQRSTSKGSQTDLPAEETSVLDEIIEETFDHATQGQKEPVDETVPAGQLASEEVRAVESPPNSPGADPRRVMPILAEDAAHLPGPLVPGLGSHEEHHKAATVHLPPKEVQERNLREARRAREQKETLSINLPPRDGRRPAEPLSSPGSTIDARSATTPALHDASTDTSPDNDISRYDQDRLEIKDDDVQTPIEFRKSPEEIAQKERQCRIIKAQIDISSAEILRSPTGIDDEDESDEQPQVDGEEDTEGQDGTDGLIKQASNVVRDIVEDEEDVAAAPSEDAIMSNVGETNAGRKDPNGKQRDVADSDAEGQTPVGKAMDVDATVKDSFDSNATIETRASTTPAVREASETVAPETDSRKSSATPAESTPKQTPSAPVVPPRMTTRVQSGAIRQKSVSDILSEIDRPNTTPTSDRTSLKGVPESDSNPYSPSRGTTPQSPGTRMRSQVDRAKERERSKLSTVVFPTAKPRPNSNNNALVPSGGQAARDTNGDYFMPLFLATAIQNKGGVPSLDSLLATAHKTITTSNAYIPINENQTVKVLRRIYNLQSSGKWSLRQPKRQVEPTRQTTHWDVLLQEAKWMRTDFREERKWKMTVARNLANACAEWVASGPEDRKWLQVKAVPPPKATPLQDRPLEDIDMVDGANDERPRETPELIASGEFDSLDEFDEEIPRLDLETIAPTAIFTLQDDEVVFGLRRSPTTDKLLNELPMYSAPLEVPSADSVDPDRFWKRRALPLSKYVEGRMELKTQTPPRKKSRFEYEEEDDDDDHVVFGEQGSKRPILAPEQTDVALFNPEHKHMRDRIHAGHQFRPPSEYPMPLQSFFECRTASQWTWAEDDELKTLVREYSYNWSLISSMLSSRSLFSSGAERRTPWECFERWISLEGLPADMQKTHYFRAYNSRLEAANRNVTAQAAQAPPQVNGQSAVQAPRRRSTISFRVERRRQQKHLTIVDAMRKLAKKRENNIQKQQHAAGLAAMRKAQEAPQPRVKAHTPQDFSRMKFEREERMKEQMLVFQQQRAEAQRRVRPTLGSGFQ